MNLLPQPGSRARFICDALIAVTTIIIVSIVVSAYQETFRHLNAMESAINPGPAPHDNARLTLLEQRIIKLEAQRQADWRVMLESLDSLTNSLPRVFSNAIARQAEAFLSLQPR